MKSKFHATLPQHCQHICRHHQLRLIAFPLKLPSLLDHQGVCQPLLSLEYHLHREIFLNQICIKITCPINHTNRTTCPINHAFKITCPINHTNISLESFGFCEYKHRHITSNNRTSSERKCNAVSAKLYIGSIKQIFMTNESSTDLKSLKK